MDYEEKVQSLAERIVSYAELKDKDALRVFTNENLMTLNAFGTFNPHDIMPIGIQALHRAERIVLDDTSKTELEKIPVYDAIEYQSYRCRVIHKLHLTFKWESTTDQEKITLIKKHIIDQLLTYTGSLKCTILEMCHILDEWIKVKSCKSINDDAITVHNALERVCVNALYNKQRCFNLTIFCMKFCKEISNVNTIEEINLLIDRFVDTLASDYSNRFYDHISPSDPKTYAIYRHRLDVRTNTIIERRAKRSKK